MSSSRCASAELAELSGVSQISVRRALAYQLRRPWVAAQWMPMAVGVLELIPAHSSGVAFSAHPTTGARDRIVVEGTFGWGESVVQGLVTPDRVELDAEDGRVLRYDLADKAVLSTLAPDGSGMVAVPMPAALRSEAALDAQTLQAVGNVVRAIDRFYGHPVDVEWVVAEGSQPRRCVVVQARPVTISGQRAGRAGGSGEPPGKGPRPRLQWPVGAHAVRDDGGIRVRAPAAPGCVGVARTVRPAPGAALGAGAGR